MSDQGRVYELATLLERAEKNGAHVVVVFPEDVIKPVNMDAPVILLRALDLTTNHWITVKRSIDAFMIASGGPKIALHMREGAYREFGDALAHHALSVKVTVPA